MIQDEWEGLKGLVIVVGVVLCGILAIFSALAMHEGMDMGGYAVDGMVAAYIVCNAFGGWIGSLCALTCTAAYRYLPR